MKLFTYLYIFLFVVGVITLIIYYILDNKLKMEQETKVLDALIPKVKNSLIEYLNIYYKYIKKNKKYLSDDFFNNITDKYNRIKEKELIADVILEYRSLEDELEKFIIILEDSNKLKSESLSEIDEYKKDFEIVKKEYNENVLIMNKYNNIFTSFFISKIYKFKDYPYFISKY
ncbi:MAG: hypothetical protein J5982_02340 [Bacilli bacterium]|nr:hypothetical protein [Bacilli bacterium]